jgi:tRNA threonylcarbamoyladenosine biosynthesis protein TsaB
MAGTAPEGPILTLDAGSPVVSAAVGRGGRLLASRSAAAERASGQLLELVRETLAEAGLAPADLAGVAALQGPGSFTGLRIGLATALGFHQALGLAATALPTLQALAASVSDVEPGAVIVAAVDSLRGEWTAQAFRAGRRDDPPAQLAAAALVRAAEVPGLAPRGDGEAGEPVVVGFGVSRLAEGLAGPGPRSPRRVEAGPLAPAALLLAGAAETEWDAGRLTRPLYARPPAITPPRPPKSRLQEPPPRR